MGNILSKYYRWAGSAGVEFFGHVAPAQILNCQLILDGPVDRRPVRMIDISVSSVPSVVNMPRLDTFRVLTYCE